MGRIIDRPFDQAPPMTAAMDKLTGSEAVYGFMGWLTSTADLWSDAAFAAELVDQFCKANGLAAPREGWERNLTHPPKPKVPF